MSREMIRSDLGDVLEEGLTGPADRLGVAGEREREAHGTKVLGPCEQDNGIATNGTGGARGGPGSERGVIGGLPGDVRSLGRV